ncbi:vitamin K epoxide reductase family protein [Aquimarina sp. 2201CG14-23]|uniref:vitamin K epoxide reductase family protein n=1 Tax=Aquimarina mycalae TaxID=3040073 RepID=UPI002477FBA4|nr:vitamin K epoxide reductase family protein [Aquimarina sp. 2201CG14-23]MDH7445476.1 vitamin K epoxide reductase family protein [Aquimarina sp. 2201CG14-23]
MENNIEKIVETVLIQNRINDYDKKDLELQLQIHPNYPSFQSITDTLDYFNIDNIAVEVPIEALDQLPKSFVSLVKKDNTEEIVSVINKDGRIQLKHTDLENKNYSHEEFKKIWSPKVIAVEHNTSGNNIFSKQSLLQNLLFGGLLISAIVLFLNRTVDINQILFLLLSISGIVFSFFAVRESLGIQSNTMHQFCTSVGSSNCGDVINNNTGKLFKNFSLADASMVFFGVLTVYQLFYGFNNTFLLPTLIGIPFIIYSIYSQAFVIKKWCAICMAISAISISMIVVAVLSLSFSFSLSLIAAFVLIATLFTLAYMYVKEHMVENKDYKSDNIKLNHFKRDRQIFDHLLSISEKIEDNSSITNEIVLGNPNANFKIISLTNPMCGYCKGAFEAYARVLRSMSEQLQVIIRLKVALDDLDNQATQISLRLMEIYHTDGADSFIKAYSEWFNDRTYSTWIKKFGAPKNNEKHIEVLRTQSEWAEKNNLFYTPASLMNNSIYPKKYSYDEFFHFTSMLIENQNEHTYEEEKPIGV